MREMYVVALSDDGRYVVLATSEDAANGGFRVALNDRLMAAVRGELPRPGVPGPREVTLTPKEIQARLRTGESAADIASSAGVPVARVERFAGPVLSEMARVIDAAQQTYLVRGRRGRSLVPLGAAVAHNLQLFTSLRPESVEWGAARQEDGRWLVTVSWVARARTHSAAYHYHPTTRIVEPISGPSANIGHVEGPTEQVPAPVPAPRRAVGGRRAATAAKKATATTSATATATAGKTATKAATAGKTVQATTSAADAPATRGRRAAAAKTPAKADPTGQLAPAVVAAPARTTASARKTAPGRKAASGRKAVPAGRTGATDKPVRAARAAPASRKPAAPKLSRAKHPAGGKAPSSGKGPISGRGPSSGQGRAGGEAPATDTSPAPAARAPAQPRPAAAARVARTPAAAVPAAAAAAAVVPALSIVPGTESARRAPEPQRTGVRARASVPAWADVLLSTAPRGDQSGQDR